MRDNNQGMIEIIDAFKEAGNYFVKIAISSDSERFYQFGVQASGFKTIQKIKQLKPFDPMPGLNYRHYWDLSLGSNSEGLFIGVRYEQGNNAKSLPMQIDKKLAENLKWFSEVKHSKEIEHLAINT